MTESWKYNGLYGDERYEIHVRKNPTELTERQKEDLRSIFYGGYVPWDRVNVLENYGLVREIGNAWNQSYVFAPCVYQWLTEPDNRDEVQASVRAQYDE